MLRGEGEKSLVFPAPPLHVAPKARSWRGGWGVRRKRHHMSSQRASHGNSRSHNVPGSIGMAQDPGRVFPGKRMTGHLGDDLVTTQNLDIVRVDEARQLLMIKGAIPGSAGGFVTVRPAVKAKSDVKGAN
jgi:large subunit ribosomal protein L3